MWKGMERNMEERSEEEKDTKGVTRIKKELMD
jgi:hypothetical protein